MTVYLNFYRKHTMPLPNLAHLQADPSTLLTWLQNNLLLSGYLENVVAPNGLCRATITQRATAAGVGTNGGAIDVYDVRSNGRVDNDSVLAYVCNYAAGNINSVQLSNLGDFVFTVTMNGCTFGVGPAAANGSRLVSHANVGGNTINQRAATFAEHGVGPGGGGIRLMEPALYRRGLAGNVCATTFGIRTGLNWNFYFQSYSLLGGVFTLLGVFPIL
jgi:hypothetical protein